MSKLGKIREVTFPFSPKIYQRLTSTQFTHYKHYVFCLLFRVEGSMGLSDQTAAGLFKLIAHHPQTERVWDLTTPTRSNEL